VPKASPRKTAYWLHLIPIETKEVLLLAAPVSGPSGPAQLAKYPSFEPLQLLLTATTGIQAEVLDEAAEALAAGKSYGIYDVILTNKQLGRLGLPA
jgi:hypothetical protein